jgi:putative lipoprotein (rSAM/lipoprotein system)
MKKMYRPLIKCANLLLGGLLALLGFSGCEAPVEYGSPHADFHFYGQVTNEAGEAIPDVKVEAKARSGYTNYPRLTNAGGQYSIQLETGMRLDEAELVVSDIDGAQNGAYRDTTIRVTITPDDYYEQGDGNWYQGAARKTVDVVLKELK